MILPLPDPSGRLEFRWGWWVLYWLPDTAEIVTGTEEDATVTLHGCWGSWIVSRDVDFGAAIKTLSEVRIIGVGFVGSVGRAAIVTPACCGRWLFIDTCTVGVEEDNAEDDDNFEEEVIGTIIEVDDDVDVAPPGSVLAVADVADVVE